MPAKPFYPWFPADFWCDTSHLEIDERGFYRDFLDHCWINKCRLSKAKFRNILKFREKKFEKYWKKIENFLILFENTGEYSQRKLLEIYESVTEKSLKNSENAKSRWKKEKGKNAVASNPHQQNTDSAYANHNHNHNQSQNHKIYTIKFLEFWKIYPKRNGKKQGKMSALENFKKIPIEELDRVIRNAGHYGINNKFAKDPERFLKKEFWKDWDEPADTELSLKEKTEARFGKPE